jgi:hypothetical protein
MDILSIILLIIIGYIIFIFINNKFYAKNNIENIDNILNTNNTPNTPNTTKTNSNTPNKMNKRVRFNLPNSPRSHMLPRDKNIVDSVIDDIVSWDGTQDTNVVYNDEKNNINPNLLDIQFHNDYRDVITAINNLIPDKKQLFNLPNMPLVYSEPEGDEVRNLVSDFIEVLNSNLKTTVPDKRNKNSGWDEAVPDATVESGWDKVQKSLGLQPSLWDGPAPKAPVKIIAIPFVQKYETEDEIKYACDIIMQKINVDDQMMIKASFVQDKRPLHDENNFFVTKNIDMKIVIEDIFTVGYLSKGGTDSKLIFDKDMEKFYDYDEMEYNNLTDPKYIQKILMEKYKNRTEEMEQRNAMLDEEGQAFHKQLPNVYDFSNIQSTRTIFDDFNKPKKFY